MAGNQGPSDASLVSENTALRADVAALRQELAVSADQRASVSEVLGLISSSQGDPAPVFEAIVRRAIHDCEAKFGHLDLWDGERFRVVAQYGATPSLVEALQPSATALLNSWRTPMPQNLREVLHLADLMNDPAYVVDRSPITVAVVELGGARTFLRVPLLKDDELIGVFALFRAEVRPFTDGQIEVVRNFAAQTVIAVVNAQLFSDLNARNRDLAESLDQQTATADVLKLISRSTFDRQIVFDKLVESATRLCRAERANIALVDGERLQYVAFSGFKSDYAAYMKDLSLRVDRGSVSGRSVLEGKIVHIHDVLADVDFKMHDAQERGSFRTALGAPLLRDGAPIGVFFLTRATVDPFTQQQIDLVANFADQAVIAIENARLLNDLRESLEQQTATAEILRAITSTPAEAERALDTVCETAARIFRATSVGIRRVEGDTLLYAGASGPRSNLVRENFPVMPLTNADLATKAIFEKHQFQVHKASDAIAEKFGPAGTIAVTPLLRGDEAIGAMIVTREDVRAFQSKELELMASFADQAVIAIENARLVNELRESKAIVEQVSRQLAKYISPQLYESIATGGQDVSVDSKRKKLTIFFSDIVGFTEITDQLESEELTALLNEYLTVMSKVAEDHGATFDKFIGDAIMCFFGDPDSRGVKEDADACVHMALAMRERLTQLQMGWREKGLIDRPFEARMGINTGYCTVGNFGSQDRMDYTIIGREVNLAARLESHAEANGILMAAETYSLVKDWLLADEQAAIAMKGFSQPIRTYRVRGTLEESARDESLFVHEDVGVRISIEGDLADKKKTKAALIQALAKLEK